MPTAVIYLRVSTTEQATRGNEAEGFSIPAQRQACERKAQDLGATVEREFVDAGESAKSADRPELQRMLAYLAEHPTTYVIVHKIDRLARNRADDVQINLAIQAAGTTLVSVTENIDATPSGVLMHGIMSSIAEFYSRNLANEVMKGAKQKALSGGTPTIAPIGYLNVREIVDGREVRTVRIDDERAPHIVWAFTQYATGDWTLSRLATALEARGLSQRPTAKRPVRSLPMNKLHQILRNRYYLGYVTWQGIEYPGNHHPLISASLFEQVQDVLTAHRRSGERSSRHRHHLAGSLYCARCDSKLIYAISTGKLGTRYPYWLCSGRHSAKNGCDLPYIPEERVETAIVGLWHKTQMPASALHEIGTSLAEDLAVFTDQSDNDRTLVQRRIDEIKRERLKWADLAMDGSVPRDIARDKQVALAQTLGQLEHQQASLGATAVDHMATVERALDLIGRCGSAYEGAPVSLRRDFNQSWFSRIQLDTDDGDAVVHRADRTAIFEILSTATVNSADRPGNRDENSMRTRSIVQGSNVVSWVGPVGHAGQHHRRSSCHRRRGHRQNYGSGRRPGRRVPLQDDRRIPERGLRARRPTRRAGLRDDLVQRRRYRAPGDDGGDDARRDITNPGGGGDEQRDDYPTQGQALRRLLAVLRGPRGRYR